MNGYDPFAWYWIIASDETRVWSSAAGAYIPAADAAYQGWTAAGGQATRIASERELTDVLAPYGLHGPYVDLVAYANGRQWAVATGGLPVTVNGTQHRLATTAESMSLMTGKVVRLQQPDPPASVLWQFGPTTFETVGAADFVAMATAAERFVQATFAALPSILDGIAAGTIATTAQIDDALAAI